MLQIRPTGSALNYFIVRPSCYGSISIYFGIKDLLRLFITDFSPKSRHNLLGYFYFDCARWMLTYFPISRSQPLFAAILRGNTTMIEP